VVFCSVASRVVLCCVVLCCAVLCCVVWSDMRGAVGSWTQRATFVPQCSWGVGNSAGIVVGDQVQCILNGLTDLIPTNRSPLWLVPAGGTKVHYQRASM
jgi:hypothetical protein